MGKTVVNGDDVPTNILLSELTFVLIKCVRMSFGLIHSNVISLSLAGGQIRVKQ